MSLIVDALSKAVAEGSSLVIYAKRILLDIATPNKISKPIIEKFFRKALRTGIWRKLGAEQRALILALRLWRGRIKSATLLEIVKSIFLEIELSTFRGKALLYGTAIAIKNRLLKAGNITRSISYILATGIMYLNNPPMLRVYG
jgi:hypothetical protein